MSLVTLVSGGIDSTLMALLAQEERIPQFPLFIDYGQICKDREWKACAAIHKRYRLPKPTLMDLNGFVHVISSGLTDPRLRLNEDAFLPGRNLLFLLAGGAYAYQKRANAVAIGLLNEEAHLFPDQTTSFVQTAQKIIEEAMGRQIAIITPLMNFSKRDILELAQAKGIYGTYSCHAGKKQPCGVCVSCMEVKTATSLKGERYGRRWRRTKPTA